MIFLLPWVFSIISLPEGIMPGTVRSRKSSKNETMDQTTSSLPSTQSEISSNPTRIYLGLHSPYIQLEAVMFHHSQLSLTQGSLDNENHGDPKWERCTVSHPSHPRHQRLPRYPEDVRTAAVTREVSFTCYMSEEICMTAWPKNTLVMYLHVART